VNTKFIAGFVSSLALAAVVTASVGAQALKPRAPRTAHAVSECSTSVLAESGNLIDTTWLINYMAGKAGQTDYQTYGTVTFRQCGKAVFHDGETGTWSLTGERLIINNEAVVTNPLRRVEVVLRDDIAEGTVELTGTKVAQYRARLVRHPADSAQARVFWSNASSASNCALQCLRKRHDIGYAGCEVSSYYAASIGRCQCILSTVATKSATELSNSND
jgi:methyl coenzyme M reductase alpha subunit